MAQARLGDDVYGEDPTVNELEAMAAAKVSMEAGLFVASGTMGNLVSILSHANRGDELVVGIDTHSYRAEAGGMSAVGGILPRALKTDETGRMDLDDIEGAIQSDDPHYGCTRLIMLENTYGARGGSAIEVDYFRRVREIADTHGLKVHLDGARLFNACAALHVEPREITQFVDSVSFCLSKGLCAPVGSLVCGSADFTDRARRARKVLGGGMRQAGVLAAAGVVAIQEMIERLPVDHDNARRLSNQLAAIKGIKLEKIHHPTNMVLFSLSEQSNWKADEFVRLLAETYNIYLDERGDGTFRAVTHYWAGADEVDLLVKSIEEILTMSRVSVG